VECASFNMREFFNTSHEAPTQANPDNKPSSQTTLKQFKDDNKSIKNITYKNSTFKNSS
jgi:hypothetical protein